MVENSGTGEEIAEEHPIGTDPTPRTILRIMEESSGTREDAAEEHPPGTEEREKEIPSQIQTIKVLRSVEERRTTEDSSDTEELATEPPQNPTEVKENRVKTLAPKPQLQPVKLIVKLREPPERPEELKEKPRELKERPKKETPILALVKLGM
jgi:hypothetical protein